MKKRCRHRRKYVHEIPWSVCVTPRLCAAKPERQAAHGGTEILELCRDCGAFRRSETNAGHLNRGRWEV